MEIPLMCGNVENDGKPFDQRCLGKERRSFSQFLHVSCAMRGEGGKFSLRIALALLILSISTAVAQSVTHRNFDQDFDTLGVVGNKNPYGIWSDSTTNVGANGRKLYAYNLPQPGASAGSSPSKDSNLKDLQLSGVVLSPIFSRRKRITRRRLIMTSLRQR